jgi:hypothetical protein
MPGKRKKSSKSSGRKKAAVPASKKKHSRNASSPYHDYELDQDFQNAIDTMDTDVKTILKKLNENDENDLNSAPTTGIRKRIKALVDETTNTNLGQAAHDNRIERILYAIGGMNDQYYIDHKRPKTQAYPPPTGGAHEDRVLTLLTTINNICRDVFSLLEPGTKLKDPPKPSGDYTKDIVAMAVDTQMVVNNILNHILHDHPGPISAFSK